MDKQLVGKWYKKEEGETINIFDSVPFRMKMSFSSIGYYNFEPNIIYKKDGYFCYEVNDEYNRRIYYVKVIDNNLEGYYTQYGKQTPIKYVKLSDVPEDEPYRFEPTEVYVPESNKTRLEILTQYANYDQTNEYGCSISFVFENKTHEILNKYHYYDYVKDLDNSNDELVFKLLDFVCDNFGHDGAKGLGHSTSIETLIEFCERNNGKSNCRGLAILLSCLLRLNGIKAQHITCMPYEEPFNDCHVVVDCLLPSGKRIMLDPTWRLYLKDKEGNYVSLPRLRELLLANEPLFENPTAGYNGQPFAKEYHRNYMTKNCFRFARNTLSKDGIDGTCNESRYIELIPLNYPIDEFSKERKKLFVYNDIEFWKM